MEKHSRDAKMRNRSGEIFPSDGISLFNSKYLEKVSLWYDNIMPFISKREVSKGGPVILMQICNEIGVFSWLAHQADYGNAVTDRFRFYLTEKFNKIDEINKLWGTNYQNFSQIELPPDGKIPYASKEDRGRDIEWHLFWRRYYGDYLRMLTGMARDRGITVPLYHNLPGWIYGNGYEFPVNISMYEDLFEDKSEIIFGVDHIPEFLSYRNLHDDRNINDITYAMQGKKPLFAAEFQCGSREYHVVTNPREMELFYKASIANGLTGWNYYMFSQGRNPRHKGYSGATFYWFNPLTAEGNRTSAFPLVKQMNRLLKTSESLIVEAKRKSEVCVLFYPPYYATELERPVDSKSELVFNPSAIRRSAYFDGLLKVLQVLNIDYDMADLGKITAKELSAYKQVWAFSTDEMNSRDQQVIVDYTRSGGNVVIYPYLPDREMSQQKCTLIRDSISVSENGLEIIDSPLIDLFDLIDLKCANPLITYSGDSLKDAKIIARTISGSVCGFSKPIGKGTLIHLGTWMGFDTEGHKPAYEALLKTSGARLRQTECNNEYITVRQRFTPDQSAVLFVGNYYNEDHTGRISYTHPESGETINIPYQKEEILWPGLYGILSPVCLSISEGIKILHCTSDILGITSKDQMIEICLQGDRDLAGEIVFEGINAGRIKSASSGSEIFSLKTLGSRVFFSCRQKHKEEFLIQIALT